MGGGVRVEAGAGGTGRAGAHGVGPVSGLASWAKARGIGPWQQDAKAALAVCWVLGLNSGWVGVWITGWTEPTGLVWVRVRDG